MKSSKILLSLVVFALLFGNLFSFDVKEHLYLNEDDEKLTQETFIVNGQEYTLVKYDSAEIFLLLGGNAVEDQAQINDAIGVYYRQKYYPGSTEIEELSLLIEQFKDSRDSDAYSSYGLTKDQVCLANLFMITLKQGKVVDLFPCYDQESCEYTELMFCSAIGDKPFSMCRPGELIEDFKYISYASRGLTTIMGNITEKFNNQTSENELYDSLKYIYENSDSIKKYSQDIGSSLFKTPVNFSERCNYITMNLPQYGCFRICGNLEFDISAVNEIKTISKNLMDKMEPFAKRAEIANNLYTQTNDRIEYKLNTELAESYNKEFEPVYLEGIELENEAAYTLENKISDKKLNASYIELKTLGKDINDSIYLFNFTNIDGKITAYISLMNKTRTQLNITLALYDELEIEKSQAETYLLYLELKGLDQKLEEQVDEIKKEKEELDENLSKTTSTEKITEIEQGYEEIMLKLNQTVENQKENIVFDKLRAFARKVNANVDNLINEIHQPTYEEKMNYSQNIPIYLSVVNFVSISCVGAFIFLVLISRMNFTKMSQILVYLAIMFIFVLGAGIFSYGFYYYLDHTTNVADLNEFTIATKIANTTAIVLNLNNVSDADMQIMKNCANGLSEVFKLEENETVDIYEINNGCYKNGEMILGISSKKCIETVDGPMIYFEYQTTYKKPIVNSIFIDKLTLYGNTKFYRDCNIESIFRVIEFGG
ncbi:MAG: hypothetical protein WC501_03700 [Candidatus Micrarchaeia archaeon]